MERLNFLTPKQVSTIAETFATPIFVYDEASLIHQAKLALSFPDAFGLRVRFAMKSNPNGQILKLLHAQGLYIDASSAFEVERAIKVGIPPEHILLTAQEAPSDYRHTIGLGIEFNATSLHQLELFAKNFPGQKIGVRINPGLGSGGINRTNVGGPSASFGIWKDYLKDIKKIVQKHKLTLTRIHTHIGSGSDPHVWQKVAELSLDLVEQFTSVKILNLGGGFKVGRMAGEKSTDLQEIGQPVKKLFENFYHKTGRKIKLEIEPGTFITAKAGSLICNVLEVVDTGKQGYKFLKLNAGMTEVLRPAMYGSQHPLVVVSNSPNPLNGTGEYLVVGHCCESGDIFTPTSADPEGLSTRTMALTKRGDLLVVEGVGAYCASMAAKNYNSFPEAPEVILRQDGTYSLIRHRQTLQQILANEVMVDDRP